MCGICGCEDHPHHHHHHLHEPKGQRASGSTVSGYDHLHSHHHDHDAVDAERRIGIEQAILAKNDGFAAANRRRFEDLSVLALNLVSSPGAGKTSLLVATIERLESEFPIGVVEGDQATERDAERVRACGVPAVQINTGHGCHLDAHAVGHALDELPLQRGSLVLIENVGNLVCPSAFDLGETCKVVILSVAEGDDKPIKYPDMFAAARLMILSKLDLLPHLEFDPERAIAYARRVNPGIEILALSARTGEGLEEWLNWIRAMAEQVSSRSVEAGSERRGTGAPSRNRASALPI